MTNGDVIRQMTDDKLISLLCEPYSDPDGRSIPGCSSECERDGTEEFCIIDCPVDYSMMLTEKAIRKWIAMEADDES